MRSMQWQLGMLGTVSAFVYRHRETKKNLCRGGRSQDLPNTNFQPAARHLKAVRRLWVQISARRPFILTDASHGFRQTSDGKLPKVRHWLLPSTHFSVIIGLDTVEPLALRSPSGFLKWFFNLSGFKAHSQNCEKPLYELRHVCLPA